MKLHKAAHLAISLIYGRWIYIYSIWDILCCAVLHIRAVICENWIVAQSFLTLFHMDGQICQTDHLTSVSDCSKQKQTSGWQPLCNQTSSVIPAVGLRRDGSRLNHRFKITSSYKAEALVTMTITSFNFFFFLNDGCSLTRHNKPGTPSFSHP